MIVLYNDKFIVTPDEQWYSYIKQQLTYVEKGRQFYLKNKHKIQTRDEIKEVFTMDSDSNMYVPYGLYPFFEWATKQSQVIDKRYAKKVFDVSSILEHINDYKNILNGIELRNAQLISIWKALKYRRGILQLATGSG